MTTRIRMIGMGVLTAIGLTAPPPATAVLAQRTFVSSGGLDTNACSLTAPCRGFAAALVQTKPGGEIVVLDSAGYGGVTITQAVSIVVPPGIYAGVSVTTPGTDGIVVSAGAADEVILRGLTINNQGGNNGVVFNSGAALYVESCTIRGFSLPGMANLRFAPGGASKLFVKDSYIRGGQAGINLANGATLASATIDNTRIENNVNGVTASFSGALTLRNSIVAENTNHGVSLQTGGGQALDAALDNVMVSNNDSNGVNVAGSNITVAMSSSTVVGNITGVFVQGGGSAATARLTNNVISRNTTGIQTGANGSVLSPASNTIEGNGTDGAPAGYSPK
jgi:parallel beta helix pectate lyase-like protein